MKNSNFSCNDPEWLLICRCIVDYANGDVTQAVEGVDWVRLLRIAERHRIQPLLSTQLVHDANRNANNKDGLAALLEAKRSNMLTLLRIAKEQETLLAAMSEQRVNVSVLKGLPIAAHCYSDIVDRHVGDIDLLVNSQEELTRVHPLILSMGYEEWITADHNTAVFKGLFNSTRKENVYRSPCGTYLLEVHWPNPRVPIFSDALLASLDAAEDHVDGLGYTWALPGPQLLLAYLIWHGGRCKWFRLKWLIDVYLLLRKTGYEDDAWYAQVADQSGPVSANIAAGLLSEFFSMPQTHSQPRRYRFVRYVTYRLMGNIGEPSHWDKLLGISALFSLRPDWKWRWYVLTRAVFKVAG